MSVSPGADGGIVLDGDCPVEDAERLLELLQTSAGPVDWSRCSRLHTAVLQIILAAGRPLVGPCGDAFVRQWLERDLGPA